MTEEVKLYKIRKSTLPNSRYRKHRKYYDKENDVRLFETYESPEIDTSPTDILHTVSSGEEGRLDLISLSYYSTEELWWVIAEANDLFDPINEVVVGMVLRIPSVSVLYGYKGVLS